MMTVRKCGTGSSKFAHSMNPRLPGGRIVIVIAEYMIFPSCPEKRQNGGKKMETLGVIENVSPMANCDCGPSCAACSSSDPYSSINNTNNAIVTVDA
jgi:hypothetical protein